MSRLVMKFGGTSMTFLERIRPAAELVASEVQAGKSVAVVVSAMAGITNQMVAWADQIGPAAQGLPASDDEYDVVVTAGEQITTGLMAMMLRSMGVNARSWLSWQVPIWTDAAHGKARIADIETGPIAASMDSGVVAVIPGFQGLTPAHRLTALGRGGSDTSAVAVAAALGCPCDIYTDVPGVYTTDPRIEPKARMLDRVSYEEMLELASMGAKVLQTRSVELAMAYGTPLRVLSSALKPGTQDGQGTLICNEDLIMEKRIVSGIALSGDEARVTLIGMPAGAAGQAEVFAALAEANLNIDMIVQARPGEEERGALTFTLPRRDAARAAALMEAARADIGFQDVRVTEGVSKVSVIGVGMRSHAGVAGTAFQALADAGIEAQAISTSEVKISVLIDAARGEDAVRALHAAFGLDTV
jgi:aspartate kinase